MKAQYDVVVIGSGFGGSVTACRLAQAGRSVCVLEKGRRWTRAEFPRTPYQLAGALWAEGRRNGLIEYKAFERVHTISGVGVGGGSLVYFNVHLRAPERVIQGPAWPAAITRKVLDPYYDLAREMLDVAPLAPPAGSKLPNRTQAFLEAAEYAGKKAYLPDIAVHVGSDRRNPHSGLPQGGCNYQGNCGIGCSAQAKNTLDLNYLAVAELNGAEVYPLHQVEKIEPLGESGFRVTYKELDPDQPQNFTRGEVTGEKVILGAGTLGTNGLLLRCKEIYKTLPGLSPALGRHYSGNGDFLFAGTEFPKTPVVDPGRGPSITASADFSSDGQLVLVQDLGYPVPLMWAVEGILSLRNPFRILSRWLRLYVRGFLRVPGSNDRLTDEWEQLTVTRSTGRYLPYLVMGLDSADGQIRLDERGEIDILWDHTKDRAMLRAIEDSLRSMSRYRGGKYVTSPLWKWPLRKLLTAHPLGGCVLSEDPQRGVTDEWGEVWNYPGLFIADASLIPTSLGVNPSATICALAERVAFNINCGREMQAGDPSTPVNH